MSPQVPLVGLFLYVNCSHIFVLTLKIYFDSVSYAPLGMTFSPVAPLSNSLKIVSVFVGNR